MKKLTFLLLFVSLHISAQDPKLAVNDSLVEIIETTKGKEKLKTILQFCITNNLSSAKQTIEYSSEGILLADQLKDYRTKAELLRYKGISACTLGKMDTAKTTIEKAIVLSRSINDSLILGKCFSSLGRYYFVLGDFNKSRMNDSLSIVIGVKINDVEFIYSCKHNMASSYLGQGLHAKALEVLNDALAFCNMHQLDCAGTILNRAIAINNIGKPSQALGYFFDARKAFLDNGEFSNVALVEHHIGHLLQQTELYEEAQPYYDSAKEYYEKSGNVNRLSSIHMSMGELMLELDRLDEAETFLQKAIDFKNDSGLKTIGDPLIDLGLVALKRENNNLAFDYFKEAQKVFDATENIAGIVEADNYFSMSYLSIKDFEKAEKYALQALSLNKEFGRKRQLALSYENLVNAYEGQYKFDLALQAKKELEVVNQGLNSSKELLAITKKLVVETLRKNKEDSTAAASNIDNSKTAKFSNIFWVMLVFIMMLLEGGFYYFKLQNKPVVKNGRKQEYLQKEEASVLLKNLKHIMETEKPYLEQEITLNSLAEFLETSDKKLSFLLNHSLATSFYDYVNRYRIEAVKKKLALPEYEKYSLVGIAYTCGFNSKSSFYRAFKKETGISPTAYKAQKTQ